VIIRPGLRCRDLGICRKSWQALSAAISKTVKLCGNEEPIMACRWAEGRVGCTDC
jgi:hypothetical protein